MARLEMGFTKENQDGLGRWLEEPVFKKSMHILEGVVACTVSTVTVAA